ncbi:MAG: hypothetical protein AVDCRST_MAG89-2313, partial [uncultured Gemmatimonadetes bacterium]
DAADLASGAGHARGTGGAGARRGARAAQAGPRRGGAGGSGHAPPHHRAGARAERDELRAREPDATRGAGPPLSRRRVAWGEALRRRLPVDAARGPPPARTRQGVRRLDLADGGHRLLHALARGADVRQRRQLPGRGDAPARRRLPRGPGALAARLDAADHPLDAAARALDRPLYRRHGDVPPFQRAGFGREAPAAVDRGRGARLSPDHDLPGGDERDPVQPGNRAPAELVPQRTVRLRHAPHRPHRVAAHRGLSDGRAARAGLARAPASRPVGGGHGGLDAGRTARPLGRGLPPPRAPPPL